MQSTLLLWENTSKVWKTLNLHKKCLRQIWKGKWKWLNSPSGNFPDISREAKKALFSSWNTVEAKKYCTTMTKQFALCYDLLWLIVIHFIHFVPFWSTTVHFDPLWSTLIHCDPLCSTMIHFVPLWSTMIHYLKSCISYAPNDNFTL